MLNDLSEIKEGKKEDDLDISAIEEKPIVHREKIVHIKPSVK